MFKKGDWVILRVKESKKNIITPKNDLLDVLNMCAVVKIRYWSENNELFEVEYKTKRFRLTKSYYDIELINEYELPEDLFKI